MRSIRRKTIRAHIIFAFSALIVLIVLLEALAFYWVSQMLDVNALREAFARLKDTQIRMKGASNEFILREKSSISFFETGKSEFLERYQVLFEQTNKCVREIQSKGSLLGNIEKSELEKLSTSINLYNDVFLGMVDKIKTRGYGKFGLIGEFDKSVADLVKFDFGGDTKAIVSLQLYVKDYLLTGNEKLIEDISNEVFNFSMILENHIKDEEVETVTNILSNYELVFKQLTEIDKELGIYSGEGLQKRLFLASDNLERAIQLVGINEQINKRHALNIFKLYSSFFLVVGSTLIAAYFINRRLFNSVVKPIHDMKAIITRMSKGEVPESMVNFKVGDLNEIASALNNLMLGTKNYHDFATNIGKDKLDITFTPLSENDVLGRSLLAMRDSLKMNAEESKKRTWAAQGQAELGATLRANSSLDFNSYSNILRFIVKYVDCNQGSLFLLHKDGDEECLELTACFAWDKRKYLTKKITPGVGLAGQCFMEREPIYITDIPKNYVSITSGLGQATPTSLIIVPLVVDDKAIGVLEMATFNKLERYQIELIKKFSESVAATINAENINKSTRQLLQQSQEQTELLMAKEEELRKKMEELQNTEFKLNRQLHELANLNDELQIELKTNKLIINQTALVTEIDMEGIIVNVNGELCKASGFSKEELVGKPISFLQDGEEPNIFAERKLQ